MDYKLLYRLQALKEFEHYLNNKKGINSSQKPKQNFVLIIDEINRGNPQFYQNVDTIVMTPIVVAYHSSLISLTLFRGMF